MLTFSRANCFTDFLFIRSLGVFCREKTCCVLHIIHSTITGESFTHSLLAREWYAREWYKESPEYCRKVYWTKMVRNGQSDHFGQSDLIPNLILVFARPKWTKMVHFGPFWSIDVYFGPFRSAKRTLATPDGRNRCAPTTRVWAAKPPRLPSFLCALWFARAFALGIMFN